MVPPRPGWLVVLFATVISVSGWLPWLTTTAEGGGRASAIGGTRGSLVLPPHFGEGQLVVLLASALIVAGAMTARGLSARISAVAALAISLLIGVLTASYYHVNVHPPLAVGYGFFIGAAACGGAVICSLWAVATALSAARGKGR